MAPLLAATGGALVCLAVGYLLRCLYLSSQHHCQPTITTRWLKVGTSPSSRHPPPPPSPFTPFACHDCLAATTTTTTTPPTSHSLSTSTTTTTNNNNTAKLKLATLNIRYLPPWIGPNPPNDTNAEFPWSYRREALADHVLWEEPDIIGFQEVLEPQFQDLRQLLGAQYDSVGAGREDGKTRGEACPLFWKRDRVEMLNFRHFWLSLHPDVPGSKDWDAALSRMATLVHFRFREDPASEQVLESRKEDQDLGLGDAESKKAYTSTKRKSHGEEFYVLNTHYDHIGIVARQKSSELILNVLSKITKSKTVHGRAPLVIVMGDLNSPANEEGYQTLTGHRYVEGRRPDPNAFFDTRSAVKLRPSLQPLTNNRTNSTQLPKSTYPVTPTPSANQQQQQPAYQYRPFGSKGTFTNFGATSQGSVIDFIMVADNGVLSTDNTSTSSSSRSSPTIAVAKRNSGSDDKASSEDVDKANRPRWQVARFGVLPNRFEDGNYTFRLSDHSMVVCVLDRCA